MLSFSAAVSIELRTLMEKARTIATDMLNVSLTAPEQVWSRQLYYMLSLSTSGEAQRRLQNVPEGEGAEPRKVFSEDNEPKTATRYVGMLRQILLYDFGELTQLIDRIEQFRHLVRKYEEQSGESVTDNVWQAVFQAGIPRADSGGVQRVMALRREQPVEQVERIAGNPAIEEKRQEMSPRGNLLCFHAW